MKNQAESIGKKYSIACFQQPATLAHRTRLSLSNIACGTVTYRLELKLIFTLFNLYVFRYPDEILQALLLNSAV